jgi:hypothetical protein
MMSQPPSTFKVFEPLPRLKTRNSSGSSSGPLLRHSWEEEKLTNVDDVIKGLFECNEVEPKVI